MFICLFLRLIQIVFFMFNMLYIYRVLHTYTINISIFIFFIFLYANSNAKLVIIGWFLLILRESEREINKKINKPCLYSLLMHEWKRSKDGKRWAWKWTMSLLCDITGLGLGLGEEERDRQRDRGGWWWRYIFLYAYVYFSVFVLKPYPSTVHCHFLIDVELNRI